MTDTLIVPVILSGGSGTRLWPMSRESFPKQLWPLVSDRTMLQETAMRAYGSRFARPIIVCNQEHRFLIADQLRAVGIHGARIILEPVGRNSAPAITAAALMIAEENPDAILWVMPADAAINNVPALHSALERAVTVAGSGHIVTFGIHPTRPETGYGYIRTGTPLTGVDGAYQVVQFIEKPDIMTATSLVADGKHLWNSGMFVFVADVLLTEMKLLAPDVVESVSNAMSRRQTDPDFIRPDPEVFAACRAISIDYAVAERTTRAAVVTEALGWSDVGNWTTLWEIGPKDQHGNVVLGDTELIDTHDCYVHSDGCLSAVIGLRDVALITTRDAVLAMPRSRAQDVTFIVNKLKAAGRQEATTHHRTHRPWGYYEHLIRSDRFQVKRVMIRPGEQLSLQNYSFTTGHWIVASGTARVMRDAEDVILRENDTIYLPMSCVYRLENPGVTPLTLIEVQVSLPRDLSVFCSS